MALSAHEQNLIEQLEKQFKDEDPKFAKAMEQVPARNRSALRIVTGVATVVAGFLLLLLGAALQGPVPNILVGVLGFAVMIVGAHLAMRHTSVTKTKHLRRPLKTRNRSKGQKRARIDVPSGTLSETGPCGVCSCGYEADRRLAPPSSPPPGGPSPGWKPGGAGTELELAAYLCMASWI